jgi:ABC-type transporter Mla subunit MlaD
VNRVLQRLPQVSADVAATAGALDDRDRELDALTVEFDRVAAQVASEDTSLRADLLEGAALLDTLAAHQQRLQDELVAADSSLGKLNGALGGHEASLNQLLKEQPALLDELRQFQDSSSTTFATIDPCVNDLLATLAEMRSATDYRHPAGATDGNGFMLRVEPQVLGASTGTFAPAAPCSGGTP